MQYQNTTIAQSSQIQNELTQIMPKLPSNMILIIRMMICVLPVFERILSDDISIQLNPKKLSVAFLNKMLASQLEICINDDTIYATYNKAMRNIRTKKPIKLQTQNQSQVGVGHRGFNSIPSSIFANYQPIPSTEQETIDNIISINNHAFAERRAKYSKDFRQSLDPRDREVILPFQTQFNISKFIRENQEKKEKILQNHSAQNQEKGKEVEQMIKESTRIIESQEYLKMRREIYDYVSEVCENVNSIVFQLLNKGELTQNEAKALAAKNILANIQSILTQVKIKFSQSQENIAKECEQLLEDLTRSIDEQLNEIMSQLANHYPQAPAAGETARMKEVITDINRSQDQHNDLIFANQIKIERYIKYSKQEDRSDPQDYTGFLMEVINKAITITREPFSKESDQTIFEKFNQFSEALFCHGQSSTITNAQQRQRAVQHLKQILFPPNKLQPEIQGKQKEGQNQFNKELQEMRTGHKYGIAQKIPNYVKPFNDIAVKNASFSAHHSSVLRIMTKWAEYLEDIFQRPQIHITQRVYEFKDILDMLNVDYMVMKDKICSNLKDQYQQIKKRLKEMQKRSTLFQSYFFSQAENGTTYLKRFTETRSASSQMNTVLIEFTRKYLCILIHHLIRAGQGQINLVMFRVGDLLRSKLQCSESSFINIVKMLYLLDQSKEMEGKFKLVRIKNKLNDKDNNILINYMFMGKVQCQLQLSIQDMAKKDKNYYAFTHFLYQLTRGKFGVLTECAIIVSQHDPIVNSSNDTYYKPKNYDKIQEGKQKSHSIHEKEGSIIYKCWKCHQIILGENTQLFVKQMTCCNQCIVKGQDPEQKLNNREIMGLIKTIKYIQDTQEIFEARQINYSYYRETKYVNQSNELEGYGGTQYENQSNEVQSQKENYIDKHERANVQNQRKEIKKIRNYGQIKEGKYVLSIINGKVKDEKEIVKLFRVWENSRESKLFMVGINKKILATFNKQGVEFSGTDYFDISQKHKKNEQLKEITYIIDEKSLPLIFKFMEINSSFKLKLDDFLQKFQQYRLQKSLINTIKTKSEIIDLTYNPQKLPILNKIAQAYGENKKEKLLYQKCNVLDYRHIKKINLQNMSLKEAPSFLKYIDRITEIYLNQNQIKTISFQKQAKLEKLQVYGNRLESINLTKNINLTKLYLSTNELAFIDLNSNINLTQLYLGGNQLTVINLTSNINLTQLNLNSNKLTAIDLTSNINLTKLDLSSNQLTAIHLTSNISLAQLNLYNNKLTAIDLSKNPKIKKLQLNQFNKLDQITFWYSRDLIQLQEIKSLIDRKVHIRILYHRENAQMSRQLREELLRNQNQFIKLVEV